MHYIVRIPLDLEDPNANYSTDYGCLVNSSVLTMFQNVKVGPTVAPRE